MSDECVNDEWQPVAAAFALAPIDGAEAARAEDVAAREAPRRGLELRKGVAPRLSHSGL